MRLLLSSEAERNPLEKHAVSATLDVQSTTTELGRDRDMRRNLPMGALLAPQPKAQEKKLGRRTTAEARTKKKCIFYIDIHVSTRFRLETHTSAISTVSCVLAGKSKDMYFRVLSEKKCLNQTFSCSPARKKRYLVYRFVLPRRESNPGLMSESHIS